MTILFAAAARRVFADGATIAHSSQEGHMIGMRLVLAIALTFAAIASADADKKKNTIEVVSPSFGDTSPTFSSGSGRSKRTTQSPKQNVGTSGARHK
jgi:hypothetical protein